MVQIESEVQNDENENWIDVGENKVYLIVIIVSIVVGSIIIILIIYY